ncbi:MAG: hypothetical protein DRJ37_04430 [Thermoprotei archaeon]|nr:MAG: hypothetical protein DRJ37_04430 [Thermoprotei archaeon]
MYREIPLGKLVISRCNVRQRVDEETIRKLAENIRREGLHEPLVVRKEDGKYGVFIGGRRLRAIQLIKKEYPEDFERLFPGGKVPCIVKQLSEKDAIMASLSENYHKQTLSDEEYGAAIRRLEEMGVSEAEISERLRMDIFEIKKALELYEAVRKAEVVPTARPGRPPEKKPAKKEISRKALVKATVLSRKLEKQGVVKRPERFVKTFVKKTVEGGLSSKEIDLLAEKIKREAPKVRSEEEFFKKLDDIVKSIKASLYVERVILIRKDLADAVAEYAKKKGKKFDEAINELVEVGLKRRGIIPAH